MLIVSLVVAVVVTGAHCGYVGPRITSRDHEEIMPGRQIVIPGIQRAFQEDGKVTSFEYYNVRPGKIRFQIWRYRTFHSAESSHLLDFVGETSVVETDDVEGVKKLDIFSKPIHVKKDDVLGLEYLDVNPLPYDENGDFCDREDKTMYREFDNTTLISVAETISFMELPSLRDPCRTYSFRAEGIYASEECASVPVTLGETGVLTSPGFTGTTNYKDNIDSCWLLSAPNEHVVKVNMQFFALEPRGTGGTCYDYLLMADGEFKREDNVIAKLCGKNLKLTEFYGIKSRHMYVQFVTDVANRNRGFNLTFRAVESTSIPDDANKLHPNDTTGPDDHLGKLNGTEKADQGKKGDKTGLIVGVVIGVVVFIVVVIVVVIVLKKKGIVGKGRRTSQGRVADSGRSDLVSNEEEKETYRTPTGTPRQVMHGCETAYVPPIPHAHVRPASVLRRPPPQEPQKTSPPMDQGPPLEPTAPPLSRAKTPVGPPSSHLPPLQHTAVIRPFTAANPPKRRRNGPKDHHLVPVDIDPETSREMGTPLPTTPEPGHVDGHDRGSDDDSHDGGAGAGNQVSYQNPAFDNDDVADDEPRGQDQMQSQGDGRAEGYPISPPPPYTE